MPHITRRTCRLLLLLIVGLLAMTAYAAKADSNTLLPEVVVKSRRNNILHLIAYVREYSTLTTYTDTVFLYREKTVDYMLPADRKSKYQGWSTPRVLASTSYYRFTNDAGLDSVSDASNYHFSWSDWIGLPPPMPIPELLARKLASSDTVKGKYSPTEIWHKEGDRITVDINVLADPLSRRWIPALSPLFQKKIDFEQLRLHVDYDNVLGEDIYASDLIRYSFEIESAGRGHGMFRFNRYDQDFFVNTKADVYVIDREFLSFKEAKNWERYGKSATKEINGIFVPVDAPALEPEILALMERIDNLDKGAVRLEVIPDHRFVSKNLDHKNFQLGRRALLLFKRVTGISAYKSRKKLKNAWNEFRNECKQRSKNRRNETE